MPARRAEALGRPSAVGCWAYGEMAGLGGGGGGGRVDVDVV